MDTAATIGVVVGVCVGGIALGIVIGCGMCYCVTWWQRSRMASLRDASPTRLYV